MLDPASQLYFLVGGQEAVIRTGLPTAGGSVRKARLFLYIFPLEAGVHFVQEIVHERFPL